MYYSPHISTYHKRPEFKIGPDTKEIIIVIGRNVSYGTVYPEFELRIYDPVSKQTFNAPEYARRGEVFHFQLPEEIYNGEFCSKYFKVGLYREDCLVECLDMIRGPAYFIKGLYTTEASCHCSGNEWVETLCECEPKTECKPDCKKPKCSPCDNPMEECEVVFL